MTSIILGPAQAKKLTTWTMLAASAVAVNNTGNISENTIATIAVPAGAMGPNGVLKIWCLWSYNNNANSKTLKWKLGGTAFYNQARTTQLSDQFAWLVRNRNNQASQVAGGHGSTTVTPVTMAIDTSLAQNLTVTAQLANAGDLITLEAWQVEIYYGA